MLCPLCDSEDVKKIDTYTSPGYDVYRCISCDGIFSDPMQSGGKEWYEKSEWYDFNASSSIRDLRWYEEVFLQDKPNNGKGLLLNIGCGRSNFLKRVEDTGYKVFAIDFNKDSVEFTKNKLGIKDAYAVDVFDFAKDYKGEKFDVIVFFEVLEHLGSPAKFIEAFKGILKGDGYIVLSVPNRDRFKPDKNEWDYPPHHLTRWGALSLNNFLVRNGFQIIKTGMPPLSAEDLLNIYKIYFGTLWFERILRDTPNKQGHKFFLLVFNILFRIRVVFYNIMALFLRLFIKEGLNLYAVARRRENAQGKCNNPNI